MACFHPLSAFQTTSGAVVFAELKKHGDILKSLTLPCGQCVGCRLERSRQWAMRCMHEASLYDQNCFVTLTYNNESVPFRHNLKYADFQRFLRSLRKRTGRKIRFFACGEYGEQTWRPHFHALLFGYDFPDKKPIRLLDAECDLFTSKFCEDIWNKGEVRLGAVTFESAAYVARYCMKKITGPNATAHYARIDEHGMYSITPEFAHMSLKPGIGAPWLAKFQSDVYPRDYVVVNGKEVKPPKYYDRLMEEGLEMDFVRFDRMCKADAYASDNTNERLADREKVAVARLNLKSRNL